MVKTPPPTTLIFEVDAQFNPVLLAVALLLDVPDKVMFAPVTVFVDKAPSYRNPDWFVDDPDRLIFPPDVVIDPPPMCKPDEFTDVPVAIIDPV